MKLPWAKTFSVFHGVLLSLVATVLSASSFPVAAEIKPDVKMTHNSLVTPKFGNGLKPAANAKGFAALTLRYQIDGGTRAGNNIFYSFTQFNIPTGGTAFFNNALDVRNIFIRVTGGSASSINGILKANGTANLFLLNPNGIIFGSNAKLNIGGSFNTSISSFLIDTGGIYRNRIDLGGLTSIQKQGIINIQNLILRATHALTPTTKNGVDNVTQIIAHSCLTSRNQQRGKFTVTGLDTLPVTPYTDNDIWYALPTQANAMTSQQQPSTLPPVAATQSKPWKIGDPIIEATDIVRTKDGRILLISTLQNSTPESANSLVCHTNEDMSQNHQG